MSGRHDIGDITPSKYFFGIAALLGLLFALIAPVEGAGQQSGLIVGLLLWQGQTIGPMALLIACHRLLHQIRWFDHINSWIKLVVSGIVGALLFSPVGLLLDVYLVGEEIAQGDWLGAWFNEVLGIAPPVVICWVAINAPWLMGFRIERHQVGRGVAIDIDEGQAEPALSDSAAPASPNFFQLLPPDIRADLLILRAELHYLHVVTRKGKALILYNLRDAIDELPPDSGVQPHRSYWVSKEFVASAKRRGRLGELTLSDGTILPISRRKLESTLRLINGD